MIKFENLSVTYPGGVEALKNINLEINEGDFLIIVGLSGAGKSTLLRATNNLVKPTKGNVYVDSKNVTTASKKELKNIRSDIGMIFQTFNLVNRSTVLKNVLTGRLSQISTIRSIFGLWPKDQKKLAFEALNQVEILEKAYVRASNLSGGQQQRVGIARSLAVEPDVWFLDEPFSALDPLIRKQMQDEFLRIQSIQKKSVVFITHDFQEALRIADRIALMRDGQIVQIGEPVDLILSPKDNYVREFTKDVPWESVLQASDIIDKGKKISETAEQVPLDMPVAKMLHLLSKKPTGGVVIDHNGKKIGMATAQSFVAALSTAEN